MRRCVIVAGGPIEDYESARAALCPEDYVIYCDSGLRHMEGLAAVPSLILGDFDSHPRPETTVETIELPREKDDTDSMYAAKLALERGFEDFLLLGMCGARLDHSLGNLSLLVYLSRRGKKALLLDDYALMELVSAGESAAVEEGWQCFSVINLTGDARGITIKNAKYPLEKADISWDCQYAVSNETLPGRSAEISVEAGSVLLLRVKKG